MTELDQSLSKSVLTSNLTRYPSTLCMRLPIISVDPVSRKANKIRTIPDVQARRVSPFQLGPRLLNVRANLDGSDAPMGLKHDPDLSLAKTSGAPLVARVLSLAPSPPNIPKDVPTFPLQRQGLVRRSNSPKRQDRATKAPKTR